MTHQAHQNPFEQLAHTESLDSEPESDYDHDQEGRDEEETQRETKTGEVIEHTTEKHIEEDELNGDSIFRTTQVESMRQHASNRSDDVLSITSLSTEIVDESQVIRAPAGRNGLPPIPDLRFEQTYLKSIKDAATWQKVAWITIRDQVGWHCVQCPCYDDANIRYRSSCHLHRVRSGRFSKVVGDHGIAGITKLASL